MLDIILVILIFLIASIGSITLLVRLTYRYNAPIMKIWKRRPSDKRSFVATKNRQELVNDDYYIVEYVWTEGKKTKDYACRCLGVPPMEIRLKYGSFGRLIVVDGPVDRMDNNADPYISGQTSRFPWQAYFLVLVPPVSAVIAYMLLI